MNEFIRSFSNRETALFTWAIIAIILLLFKKGIRNGFVLVLKSFFTSKILIIFFSFILYVILCVILLFKMKFWDNSILKDTILWTFGFAFLTIFNVNKIKNKIYFKDMFFDAIKWIVIIEFIASFYTFSLKTEFIILPILTMAVLIQTFSKSKVEYKKVENLMTKFISFAGIAIFLYVVYKTITLWSALLTTDNLKSFLLPIILTILFMPFIYFLALIMEYEVLMKRVDALTDTKEESKKIKCYILQIANIDIDKLMNISGRIAKQLLIEKDGSFEKIKRISRKTE